MDSILEQFDIIADDFAPCFDESDIEYLVDALSVGSSSDSFSHDIDNVLCEDHIGASAFPDMTPCDSNNKRRMVSEAFLEIDAQKINNRSGTQASRQGDSLRELVMIAPNLASHNVPRTINIPSSNIEYMKPSTYLRQMLYGCDISPLQPRLSKRQKLSATIDPKCNSLMESETLHRACAQGNALEIDCALEADKTSARLPMSLKTKRSVYDINTKRMTMRDTCETYQYPLNIAIHNNVETATLEKLIFAAPEVLLIPDGSQKECSLSILLKYKPSDLRTFHLMILTQPASAQFRDRHNNTPLHITCSHGNSMETVQQLCILYPEALEIRNFDGITPFELAQRRTAFLSENIVAFLLKRMISCKRRL